MKTYLENDQRNEVLQLQSSVSQALHSSSNIYLTKELMNNYTIHAKSWKSVQLSHFKI